MTIAVDLGRKATKQTKQPIYMVYFLLQSQHLHPDDSRSETSGETVSGDSGRGGSEEDASASPSGKLFVCIGQCGL